MDDDNQMDVDTSSSLPLPDLERDTLDVVNDNMTRRSSNYFWEQRIKKAGDDQKAWLNLAAEVLMWN